MEGRSEDKKILSCGEHPCPRGHQFVEGRVATEGFIDRCPLGMEAGWRWAPYCKWHIDEKVRTSSLSGRSWSGTAFGSLGDGEGRWGTKLRTSHGFAPTDVNMNLVARSYRHRLSFDYRNKIQVYLRLRLSQAIRASHVHLTSYKQGLGASWSRQSFFLPPFQ
jgi:hypothetical protein